MRVRKSDVEKAMAFLDNDQHYSDLMSVTAHLVAAVSLLKKCGEITKKAAASDKMFDIMVSDHEKVIAHARSRLQAMKPDTAHISWENVTRWSMESKCGWWYAEQRASCWSIYHGKRRKNIVFTSDSKQSVMLVAARIEASMLKRAEKVHANKLET